MTQETDTLVHDEEWIDVEDGALSDDAFADEYDLGEEERPARRRRSVPPLAIGLSAVVIAGLGFIGGVEVQKRAGDEVAGGMPGGLAAMMQAGGAGAAGADGPRRGTGSGGGSGASSSSTGEVANVKGSRLYVTAADGSTVEVVVGKDATVQRLAAADVDQVRPGDTVVVTGSTAGDGSVKATAVQATAGGVSLLGGFGGRGGGPSAFGAAASGGPAGSESDAADGAGSGGGSERDAAADDSAAVDQLFESGD